MATIQEQQNQKAEEENKAAIEAQNQPEAPGKPIPAQVDEFSSLTSMFDVDNPSEQEREQLKTIWEWAKNSTDQKTIPSILYAVQQLENRLSSPSVDETRLNKIYRYVELQRQVDMATKRRDEMMRPIRL